LLAGTACLDGPTSGGAPFELGRAGLRSLGLEPFASIALSRAKPPDQPLPEEPGPACPDGMLLVQGDYCPKPVHRCLEWLDPPGKFRRCARYERPARCPQKRRRMSFCIERDEHVPAGQKLPVNRKSFNQAKLVCEKEGKRMCKESEWNFACEGEELRPYPYGFQRDPSACNADHVLISAGAHSVRDLRSAGGDYPRCVSPFGAFDMAGNLEELVARDDRPNRPALKGAHWLPGRNHCRAHQTIHGPGYAGVEIGFRCCSDAD
jgi:formylglycine-generating enzyme